MVVHVWVDRFKSSKVDEFSSWRVHKFICLRVWNLHVYELIAFIFPRQRIIPIRFPMWKLTKSSTVLNSLTLWRKLIEIGGQTQWLWWGNSLRLRPHPKKRNSLSPNPSPKGRGVDSCTCISWRVHEFTSSQVDTSANQKVQSSNLKVQCSKFKPQSSMFKPQSSKLSLLLFHQVHHYR